MHRHRNSGQNPYTYVDANPLDATDLSGLAGIGHNGGPPLIEGPWVFRVLGRVLGPLVAWAVPTDLNKGEDELICRQHFKIPSNWTFKPSKKGGGYVLSDPNNPNNNIRVMPGNPNSPNPAQQTPYVKYQNNGTNYDQNGSAVANDSAASHIPISAYNPSVMPR